MLCGVAVQLCMFRMKSRSTRWVSVILVCNACQCPREYDMWGGGGVEGVMECPVVYTWMIPETTLSAQNIHLNGRYMATLPDKNKIQTPVIK